MFKLTADKIILNLKSQHVREAKEIAGKAAEKYQALVSKSKAPYHQNTPHSHFIGKIGEIGASLAFQGLRSFARVDLEIDDVFRDSNRDRECDLIVNGLRIEIKTWKPYALAKYGACVADRQAVKLAKKADVVVYASYDERTKEYQLIGWNNMEDIANTPAQLTGPEDRPEKQVLNRIMTPRNITELPILSHTKEEAEDDNTSTS